MEKQNKQRKRQISLSTLLLLVTMIALLLAWWIDRSALKAQIPEKPNRTTLVFTIQNGSAGAIAKKLQEIFDQNLVTLVADEATNSLIVNADQKKQEQIRIMFKHLDRIGTEYVSDLTEQPAPLDE